MFEIRTGVRISSLMLTVGFIGVFESCLHLLWRHLSSFFRVEREGGIKELEWAENLTAYKQLRAELSEFAALLSECTEKLLVVRVSSLFGAQ